MILKAITAMKRFLKGMKQGKGPIKNDKSTLKQL